MHRVAAIAGLLCGGCICGGGNFSGWSTHSSSSSSSGGGQAEAVEPTPLPDYQVIQWRGLSLALPTGAQTEIRGDELLVTIPDGTVTLRPATSGTGDEREADITAAPGFLGFLRADRGDGEWTLEWRAAPDDDQQLHAISRRTSSDGQSVDCEGVATSEDAAELVVRACTTLGAPPWAIAPYRPPVTVHGPKKPLGPDYVGLELGAWLSVETLFHDCTNPEGLSVSTFAGVAVRPDGYHGLALRGGASVGAMEASHGDGGEGRWQLWGSAGYQLLDRFEHAGFTISPIVTWSRYEDDYMITAPVWGGGLSLDVHGRKGHSMWMGNLRMYGDEHGVYASWAVGAGIIE